MIRIASYEDLPYIAEIYHQNVGRSPMITPIHDPRTKEEWIEWYKEHPSDKYPFYVKEIDGSIVGWGSLNSYSYLAAYRGIISRSSYVCKEHQGKGYGTELRNFGKAKAKELGYHTLLSYIYEGNAPSIALALKEGMALWGMLPKAANCGQKRWDVYLFGLTLN